MANHWDDHDGSGAFWRHGKVTRRRLVGWGAGVLGATTLAPAPWRAAFGQAKPYKIGALQPLSGAAAAGGKTALVGSQMAVDRINKAGGQIKDSMGVDPNEYLPAAKLGVTKVNIDTDGRLVWTRVHREFFRDNPKDFDFRPPGKIFIEEYAKFIASRNVLLGSANQLPDLKKSLGK